MPQLPAPLPDEAREFFARQALGEVSLPLHGSADPHATAEAGHDNGPDGNADSLELEAYAADDDDGIEELTVPAVAGDEPGPLREDFDFDSLALEAADASATVPGEPIVPGPAPAGYHTPSRLMGADYVLTLPGVERLA